jgi:hypothetical protein
MAFSESKRREEDFMRMFDNGFAIRHQRALTAMIDRIGLDYFTIDCAENKRGELLIFEADNTAVVHNMDLPEVFPYKPPQMRAIFEAFAAMLSRRARAGREHAASSMISERSAHCAAKSNSGFPPQAERRASVPASCSPRW